MSTTTDDPPDVEMPEDARDAEEPVRCTRFEVVYILDGSRLTEEERDELRWGDDGGNNLD
jgi:hypothetical protein